MILSNENILNNNNQQDKLSYEKAWASLKEISEPVMLITALIHLGKLLTEKGEKKVFEPLDISIYEFEALFIIRNKKAAKPTDITSYSLMHPAKITRVLDKLEKLKAVKRKLDKQDRRSFRLELTETGEKLLNEAVSSFVTAGNKLEQGMGKKNVQLFSRLVLNTIETIGENNK
jgi:DNA-binding MarR family transcriptional regulator